MYREAAYGDVVAEIRAELAAGDRSARSLPASAATPIIVDPGLGFAKRAEHTFAALAGLDSLARLDRPILSGPSRKSFLNAALGRAAPAERDWGTAAAVTASVLLGAHIVRVHGVREMVDVVRVADRIRRAPTESAYGACRSTRSGRPAGRACELRRRAGRHRASPLIS